MSAKSRSTNGITVVDIVGHIDLSSSPALRKTLLECVRAGDRVAVNLTAVKYIDSSGIASLLEALKEARNNRKKFVLFGVTAAVRDVLQLTRLTKVFEIYENEQDALEASTPPVQP